MKVIHYPMFEIPTMIFHLGNWKEKKKKLVDLFLQQKMEESNDYGWDNVSTSYHGFIETRDNTLLQSVSNIFKKEFDYLRSISDIPNLNLQEVWYQKYSNTHEHTVHNHGPVGFSFVCYIDFNETLHGTTTFVSPFNNFLTGDALFHTPEIKEGTMIFFPSVLLHYAPQNKSNVDRLIISGNMRK